MKRFHIFLFAICAVFGLFISPGARAAAVSLTLQQAPGGGWRLLRGGKPYFIKGAGGSASLPALKEAGGNSIRTWGADKIGPILDEAQKLDLTVCVGIWLGHKEHGFHYDNPAQVAAQYEQVRETVLKYRDHPAVLCWALGNEMEVSEGDTPGVWKAVGDAAKLVKQLDPKHPTMTVVAEISPLKVRNINTLCPNIDIIGINSYGGAVTLPARYVKAGGVKPYVVTEFGPPGTWETGHNDWGASPELTSTEKAATYRRAYESAVQGQPLCLGSYAFTWGFKQEATATWYGMFLSDGSKLAAVDTMTEIWSGKPPSVLCPEIRSLKSEGADRGAPGTVVKAALDATDPQNRPLKVRWSLVRDPMKNNIGGDQQAAPPVVADAVVQGDSKGAEVTLPAAVGAYRLFAFVDDGPGGGAAVANLPLLVSESVVSNAKASAKADLPFDLYGGSGSRDNLYIPAGWMGNAKAVRMDERCIDNPHSGSACMKFAYADPDGWAGVVWQSPAGDWGDKPGGRDLTGAKRLVFWARGEKGGEEVTFKMGLIGADKPYGDTAQAALGPVHLTAEWKRYEVDLSGKDLSRVKTGFAWVIAGQGKPVAFYLDDIRFE